MTNLRMILLLLMVLPVFGEKVADLPEINEPHSLIVHGKTLVIGDKDCLHFYTLDPFGYLRKSGRSGDGPGEFNASPGLASHPEYLLANAMGRLLKFNWDGEFLQQIKIPFTYFHHYYPLLPVGKNYVGLPLKRIPEKNTFITVVNLYDAELKLIKELHEGFTPKLLPPPPPGSKVVRVDFQVISDHLDVAQADNKILIADTRTGLGIDVFSASGEPLYSIQKNEKKVRVPKQYKDEFWKEIKGREDWATLNASFNYIIRDYFPAFYSFKVQDNRIYLTTHAQKAGRHEIIVLDLEGNEIHRSFSFPLAPDQKILAGVGTFGHEYFIYNDSIHYLRFNETTMMFELHAQEF